MTDTPRDDDQRAATPREELERRLMSYGEPKSELEWYAMHEIERLRKHLPSPKIIYSPHHFSHAEGHLFMPEATGACTITLTGAASMTQAELDRYGRLIAGETGERAPTWKV